MDIKRIHEMLEMLTESAKSEMDKGIDNVDAAEMSKVTDMIKDLAEAMYYRSKVEETESSANITKP